MILLVQLTRQGKPPRRGGHKPKHGIQHFEHENQCRTTVPYLSNELRLLTICGHLPAKNSYAERITEFTWSKVVQCLMGSKEMIVIKAVNFRYIARALLLLS